MKSDVSAPKEVANGMMALVQAVQSFVRMEWMTGSIMV